MKKFLSNKARAWLVFSLVVIFLLSAVTAGFYFYQKNIASKNKDVVAVVGGEKIRIADFKSWLYKLDYSGSPENPTRWETIKDDNTLKKSYLDMYLKEVINKKETESLGITVTEAEIDAKYNVPGSNYAKLTEEQKRLSRETTRAAIMTQKLEDQALGWVAGDYILYRFDKYYAYEDDGLPAIQGAGDEALVAKQKAYAEIKANEAYQRLTSSQTTISGEITKIQADPEISYAAFAPLTPNISGTTTMDDYVYNRNFFDETRYSGFRQNVVGLKVNEVPKPFIMQTVVNGQMKDSAYVLFQAKNIHAGQYSNKEDWYKGLLEKYQVKIYYSNLGVTDTQDKQYGLKDVLKGLIPEAYAACPPTYTSTMKWTQLWGQLLVYIPDGVNYYAYPGAYFRMAAGNDNADPEMMTFNGDCSAVTGWSHEVYKYAEDDGTWSGLMAGAGWYNVAGVGDQMPALAHCGGTSTANLGVYAPDNTAWVKGGGSLGVLWGNCCDNGTWGDMVNEIHKGLNMSGYNGQTIHYQFTYRPHYNTAPTITPTAPTRDQVFNLGDTIWLNATTYDPDAGDTVNLHAALAKSTDGGATYGAWTYYETGLVAKNTPATIKSFVAPSNLGVGKYKWVVTVNDNHGAYNPVVPPSPNSWSHQDPWYFTVTSNKTITYNGNGNTSGAAPASQSGAVGSSVNLQPRGTLAKTGFSFAGWKTTATGTVAQYSESQSYTITSDVTMYAHWVPVEATCKVTPQSGLAPLVVKAEALTGLSPFDFEMGDGTVLTDRLTPVYYTYQKGGSYTVRITDSNGKTAICTPGPVSVADPTDNSGGEVAP